MNTIVGKALLLMAGLLLLSACNNSSGVSQADLDAVQAKADEAMTMAAEARDIAQRAEQKADQALAASNSP